MLFKSILPFILGYFLLATPAWAYNPIINVVTLPYEVSVINSDLNLQSEYLGELTGDPHMYEFAIGTSTKLTLALAQEKGKEPSALSLIVVQQNEDKGGVSEIGRLASDIIWQDREDKILGLSFSQSQDFVADLRPGVYRVEVSTPDNFGKYALIVGEDVVVEDYFKTLSQIYTFQKFFGGSIFSMLKSSYVHYPLGIILLLIIFYLTWRKRNVITNKANA